MSQAKSTDSFDLWKRIEDYERRLKALETRGPGGFVGCRVYRNSALTHTPSGSFAVIPWDAETHDDHNMHDNATNSHRLTIPAGLGGLWEFYANVHLGSSAAARTQDIQFRNQAATVLAQRNTTTLAGGGSTGFDLATGPRLFSAGDWIEVRVFQDSGGNLGYNVGSSLTFLSARFLGV